MGEFKDRLFDYAKMMNYIRMSTRKNQREISEMLDCTEVHISNVKNHRSSMAVGKIIELVNEFDLCMDEFIDTKYRSDKFPQYEERSLFGDLEQDEILFLLRCLNEYRKNKEKTVPIEEKHQIRYEKLVGKNIKRIREEKNISVKRMADAISMKTESYQNIESGTYGTTIDNYILLASELEVPVSMLFQDVIKNKKAIISYNIWELFLNTNLEEKERLKLMIEKFSEALSSNEK